MLYVSLCLVCFPPPTFPSVSKLYCSIPDVIVFLFFSSSLFFRFSLSFADIVAGLVLLKFVSSCSCF